MRGCSADRLAGCLGPKVFPAYAGMFRIKPMIEGQDDCFPRVCGDVPPMRQKPRLRQRFSPRMRGCSCFPLVRFIHIAVFPAYAGMFRRYLSPDHGARRFPRVCGDVPWSARRLVGPYAFSPRMRGCSGKSGKIPTHSHVFPAYAGMFHAVGGAREGDNGFPRVCGDVPASSNVVSNAVRFSPRMRGCSFANSFELRDDGVFPAYAGMFRPGQGAFQ